MPLSAASFNISNISFLLPRCDAPIKHPFASRSWGLIVKFDSSGQIVDHTHNPPQLLDPGSPLLRVLLFEGSTSSTGTETAYRRNAATAGNNAKYTVDEILLKPTTGRARYTLDPANNLAASN